ncbi:MAG: type II secretion system protein N [Pseudomonadales bacterium]|nr:type II secretion system protein N [Pseudomonadales bacterium]
MLTKRNLLLLGLWLLLVVVAYFLGVLFWNWYEPTAAPEKAQRVFHPMDAKRTNSASNRTIVQQPSEINTILAANLFGNDKLVTKSAQNKQIIEAPETRLKFQLQGIFVSSNATQTRALIAEKGKPAHSYKKEDQLPGNVILDDILEDRVLLRRAGRLESLSFPKERDDNRSRNTQKMLTYHKKNSATDVVSSQKQAYYENPVNSFGRYGLSMDDEQDGLRLDGGANSHLLERAGLKKGDLIRSVNGKTLSDFKADQNLVESVVASGELTVEIERAGQPIILSLPIP